MLNSLNDIKSRNYGWFSLKQKKIHLVVTTANPAKEIFWYDTENNIIEVTLVNGDKYHSGTTFDDIYCVGEVSKPYKL